MVAPLGPATGEETADVMPVIMANARRMYRMSRYVIELGLGSCEDLFYDSDLLKATAL